MQQKGRQHDVLKAEVTLHVDRQLHNRHGRSFQKTQILRVPEMQI
jgi:hypothetical protein